MANLLKTMLNEVGLDARLVWVGTSRLSYTNTFPSLVVHNHMICAVNLNNNFIFLDPTDRYSNIGEIGDHIHQQLAMIEDGDSYIIDTIPKTDYTDNTITANYGMILCDDILYIEGTISYLGEPRRNIQHLLNEYLGTYKKELLESLITNNNKKYNVEEIMFGIDSLNPSNFEVQVKMSAKNSVFSHDGQLLVPMDLGYGWPFPEIDTARSFHFNMGIRALKKYRTILTLPDSSSVIFLPSEIKKTINGASFRYSWKQIKNTVVFDKEINLVNKIIEPDDFKKWNSFIQEYKEAANQMIIISD
ncbi:MAG: DUF3858 domain-containing protein [Bacteroidetes bacterium]|nr:DUF3858 domain-containing protein [Bacteroidota bacterium]